MRHYLFTLLLILPLQIIAQQHGISYQAVIISEDEQEIPGQDINGNYLPNEEIAIRFTIYNENGDIEYQEEHFTNTDEYGMIHVVIGWGIPTGSGIGDFKEIDWNGMPISLKVDISTSTNNDEYKELSHDDLVFVPYAFHRNITATGTMIIDGASTLKSRLDVINQSPVDFTGTLNVDGTTDLNNILNVNNGSATNLSGELNVEGISSLNNNVNIAGISNLEDEFNLNNGSTANLSGELNVEGISNLNNDVNIAGISNLEDEFNLNNESTANLSGELNVEGISSLNNNVNIAGISNLEDEFNLNNGSTANLSGELNVEGISNLNNDVNIAGISNLEDEFNLNNESTANLSGELNVEGAADFSDAVNVGGTTNLNGQVTVNADVNGSQTDIDSYPLRVSGSNQGIVVTVDGGRDSHKNFITFRDDDGIQGAVEGQTKSELHDSFNYIWFQTHEALFTSFQIAIVIADVAGVDDGDAAVVEGLEMVAIIAHWAKQYIEMDNTVGIYFKSGGADYAEYLIKENSNEFFSYGDIVGVMGGAISKKYTEPERYMVVSKHPIVLGNTPAGKQINNYEKISFLGQVQTKVRGRVQKGDYIVAGKWRDGTGVAVKPEDMTAKLSKKIVGIAWSKSSGESGISMINVAVGINMNYAAEEISKLKAENQELKKEMNTIISYLQAKDSNFDVEKFQLEELNPTSKNNFEHSAFTKDNKKESKQKFIKFLSDHPGVIKDIQENARNLLLKRKVDYTKYEQTNRAVTDPDYFIDILESTTMSINW
ncbi:MAG: hypothetical protein U9N85_13500 [Bacteroidota bacterium]|nr:hypothetical protein [Bacteroidota bacterium]